MWTINYILPLKKSTVLSPRIQVFLLWILHSCRHISICSISRKADTEWCTYQCQDINPAVSLSCCYQFMSCENEMVTWADHHYLHWLYTLLHSCEVISVPYCRGHFKYTDSNKRGAAGEASIFGIYQGHTDSWLYSFYLLYSISLLLTWDALCFLIAMAAIIIFLQISPFYKIEQNKSLSVSQTQQDSELIDSMASDLSNGQPCLADLFSFAVLV